jgi:hypothetical protein
VLNRAFAFAALAIATLGLTAAASPRGWNPDAPAHLYVAEYPPPSGGPGQVAVFPLNARGNVSPNYVIAGPHTMLTAPYSLAFDARGDVYVYNSGYQSHTCDQVVEFAPGASGDSKPIREIGGSATGFCDGGGYNFAVTPTGAVYVPRMLYNNVVVFSPKQRGNVKPEKALSYVQSPESIDFDAHGNLWNAQIPYIEAVDEYSPSGKHLVQIKEPGEVYLFAIAHDLLYAPAERQNVVTITNLHTLKTAYSFTYPRRMYWSVSVDGTGYTYFLYYPPRHQKLPQVIEIYAPGGTSPVGSLGGPLTGVDYGVSARVGP